VMGTIGDDMASIFENVKETALTMQQGGGIGHDFSTLRPMGAPVKGVGADASGPLSFMDVWDSMCRTIMSAGSRRGAMMAAVKDDADWNLIFGGKTYKVVKARALWERIMQATYDVAEPGVIFIDRVN